MSCVICYDSLFEPAVGASTDRPERAAALNCGHVFHRSCIALWLAHRTEITCPTCRAAQRDAPIALYFEAESTGDGRAADTQVGHRNEVIKTLCVNLDVAQGEVRVLKASLETAAEKTKGLEEGIQKERAEGSKLRSSLHQQEKKKEDLKLRVKKLATQVADKSRLAESARERAGVLKAELAEQQRVVEGMGDVRKTNERLVRALKKERAKNETLTSLNSSLAARIADLAKPRRCASPASSAAASPEEGTSAPSEIPIIDLISEASIRPDTDGDDDTDGDLVVAPRGSERGKGAPERRGGRTFGVPLAELESAGESALSTQEADTNPFAIADKPFAPQLLGGFTFSRQMPSVLEPRLRPGPHTATRRIAAARRPTVAVSNGLGGTRRKKPSSTIQAQISWGPKK
ncbi:hypothetical protein GGF46_002013 [Coemansia sp. RSA 552]|nr:hypothetical protein GGF46_002013 [Coemansia sp. RSA 552]